MVPLDLDRHRRRFLRRQLPQMAAGPDRLGVPLSRPRQRGPLATAASELGLALRAAPRPDERDDWGSTPRLRSLEFEGTRDLCPWLAVSERAIDFQAALGVEAIRGRIANLVRHVRQRIALEPATPEMPELHAAMTAFRLPRGSNPEAFRSALWQRYRIEVPIIERQDGNLVRVSTHFYNTEEEVDRLAEALSVLTTESLTH